MPATSSSVGSGAAGAAIFADSDSRKYRYFAPRGQRATHYEDVTVDSSRIQHFRPGLIISLRRRQGAHVKENTARAEPELRLRAPDQNERTHAAPVED
jgi:propane monooxygenase small subunit